MHFPVYSKAFLQIFFKKKLGSIFGLPCRFNGTKKLLRMTLKCAPTSQPSLSKSKLSPPFTLLFISKFLEPPFLRSPTPFLFCKWGASRYVFVPKKSSKTFIRVFLSEHRLYRRFWRNLRSVSLCINPFIYSLFTFPLKRTVSTIWLVTLCCEFHFGINYQCHVIL